MGGTKLVDIDDVEYLGESASGAAFVLRKANGEKVYVPKSLVEKQDDGSFTMPEWLAEEKGLI